MECKYKLSSCDGEHETRRGTVHPQNVCETSGCLKVRSMRNLKGHEEQKGSHLAENDGKIIARVRPSNAVTGKGGMKRPRLFSAGR